MPENVADYTLYHGRMAIMGCPVGISESPRFEGCNVLQVEKHLNFGGMKLNLAEKNVIIHDAEIMLTNREFAILTISRFLLIY